MFLLLTHIYQTLDLAGHACLKSDFIHYTHIFFKKKKPWGYCNRLPLSVCPSVTLSPPKPLDKIHPNLVHELLTWVGHATAHLFWPRTLGSWGGVKRSDIIKIQLQSQFLKIFNQTLSVFSQKKEIKHIIWLPQGWDLGVLGVKSQIFQNMVMWQIKLKEMDDG